MNFDEFETKLRNVAPREIPAEWRREILGEIESKPIEKGTRITRPSNVASWWKQWLWPHPTAWASLAAVWVVIVALHFAARSEPARASGGPVRPGPEILQAFQDRTRLMAELSEESSPPAGASAAGRPRSSRRVKEIAV
jgi:hypothetical protein